MRKDKKQYEKKKSGKGIFEPMTNDQAKKLAEDLYKGLIFSDRHVQRQEYISMVFILLVLMGKELTEELQKNPPGMIYEYMSEAPMSINGMSIFTVSIDTKRVLEYYNKIICNVAKCYEIGICSVCQNSR